MESQNAKVIGISTVTMPCISQMKVPYFVLVLQDEQGNIWAQKSSKEYQIGENFEWEISNAKNTVAIVRHKYDLPETLLKLTKLIGLKDLARKKIFLLPSLNSASHPYFHDNTTPEFLDTIINWLKGEGVSEIKIGTQSFSKPLEIMAQKSGLLAVCAKHKIMPIDMAAKGFSDISECDLIFNLGTAKEAACSLTDNAKKLFAKDTQGDLGSLPPMVCFAEMEFAQDKEEFTNFYGLYLAGYESALIDKAVALILGDDETLSSAKEEEIKNVGCLIREARQKI
ncbi:MAG: hypothetical protein WC449_04190 [Candidatus Paceibacterota bacterium]